MTTTFSPKNPSGDNPAGNTDTHGASGTDLPTADLESETLKALAASLFAEESFSSGHLAVYDVTAEVMLYEKDAQAKITAASTTKLLTALTLLEYVGQDTVFTVGSELSLVGAGSSSADLVQGQRLTVEQILDALLIPSGNDAAYVIAAHVGRNLSGDPQITDQDAVNVFLEKMNDKAKSLGVKNSLFTCPDGYPDGKQYTTAEDMMLISVAAAKNATIRKTVEKTYSEIVFPNGNTVGYVNTNQLMVPSSSYYYEGTFGIKTGSTPGAGQCLIAGATAYGHELIVALFKANGNDARYTDARNALDAGFEAVRQAKMK
ncbi:MAG: D-alanyl-D-alanine carboxypeptidase [Clostridia bacterium]|nr:D-alanyl-D-alanine carboxypeptidase [Clostridia bacterium]